MSKYDKSKRLERIENGLCVKCGNELDDKNFRNCSACRKKFAEYQKKRIMEGKYIKSEQCRKKDNENDKLKKQARFEQGLCIYCGEKNETKYKSCDKCREHIRELRKKDKEYKERIGMCNLCGVVRVYGDEKRCPECRVKQSITSNKYFEKNKDRVYANEKISRKALFEKRAEQGLCHCGRKPIPGRKLCHVCIERGRIKRERNRIKNNLPLPGEIYEYRKNNGLCKWCGEKAIEGTNKKGEKYKVCQTCFDRSAKNLSNVDRENHRWRKFNEVLFEKKGVK